MLILSLDTTSDTAAVALTEDDRVLASSFLSGAKKHSETLLVQIEHLMSVYDIPVSKIDAFAVTVGPGSFTGVRIGVSTVKGLAFASGKPCIAVSSLEALAYNLYGIHGLIVPVMDARRNQFYHAIFSGTAQGLQRLTSDSMIDSASLQSALQQYSDTPIYFVGDGYALAKRIPDLPNVVDTPPILQRLQAASVGHLAWMQFQSGRNIQNDSTISPFYLRASQAERERIEKEKKGESL